MQYMHPTFHIKTLMVKRELGKDPTLANENWDRFLPEFKKVKSKEKRPYTPFPTPPQPSKEDIQLETGQYFLNDKLKSAKRWQERQEKRAEKTAENKRKREAAFIPPKEPVVQDTKSEGCGIGNDLAAMAMSRKKKAKEYDNKDASEKLNAEAYIAEPEEPSKKKSMRK